MPRKATPPLPPLPVPAVPVHVRLQQLRQDHRLTQAMLAHLTGLNQCTISRLETGAILYPQGRTLARLAEVYNLSEAQLRRVLGMHGPTLPAPSLSQPRWSERAQRVAQAFDRLRPDQQTYIEALATQWSVADALGCPSPVPQEEAA